MIHEVPFGNGGKPLPNLTHEILPETEKDLGIEHAERTLLGVSLSGLFAVWAAFNTDAFANIISISGSLWYNGFVEWMKEQTPSPQLKKVCLPLGLSFVGIVLPIAIFTARAVIDFIFPTIFGTSSSSHTSNKCMWSKQML